jgi:nitroimidazol reductase NimA-like FMN-containing flavoprotein (pyridoxamine 5'-phosphate oxidase superfamily)
MDKAAMEAVIRSSLVCRLALADERGPYVVPMSFGYRDGVLYFHGGATGRKVEIIRRDPRVCVEFDVDVEIRPGKEVCRTGMKYRSVIAFGTASFVEDREEKRRALQALMNQYAEGEFGFPDAAVDRTTCFKVVIEEMTGKQAGQ